MPIKPHSGRREEGGVSLGLKARSANRLAAPFPRAGAGGGACPSPCAGHAAVAGTAPPGGTARARPQRLRRPGPPARAGAGGPLRGHGPLGWDRPAQRSAGPSRCPRVSEATAVSGSCRPARAWGLPRGRSRRGAVAELWTGAMRVRLSPPPCTRSSTLCQRPSEETKT